MFYERTRGSYLIDQVIYARQVWLNFWLTFVFMNPSGQWIAQTVNSIKSRNLSKFKQVEIPFTPELNKIINPQILQYSYYIYVSM